MNVPKLAYTVDELVAATSIGRTKIYDEIKRKKLHPTKVGDRTLITVEEAQRWLASGRQTSAAGSAAR